MSVPGVKFPEANPALVFDLMDELRIAFEKFINTHGKPVGYMDAFMAAHNFHKLIVTDIAIRAELPPEERACFYDMALETFRVAVEKMKADALSPAKALTD